jgi:hypothetical protein
MNFVHPRTMKITTDVMPAKGTVDFLYGNRSLPLKKGGQEGFVDEPFGKIPLNPPFSKGEAAAIPPAVHLSTLSKAGIQTPPHLGSRIRGNDDQSVSDDTIF